MHKLRPHDAHGGGAGQPPRHLRAYAHTIRAGARLTTVQWQWLCRGEDTARDARIMVSHDGTSRYTSKYTLTWWQVAHSVLSDQQKVQASLKHVSQSHSRPPRTWPCEEIGIAPVSPVRAPACTYARTQAYTDGRTYVHVRTYRYVRMSACVRTHACR